MPPPAKPPSHSDLKEESDQFNHTNANSSAQHINPLSPSKSNSQSTSQSPPIPSSWPTLTLEDLQHDWKQMQEREKEEKENDNGEYD